MVFCAPTPALVSTILGSCVAVCLWDTRLRLGGMNHYVLPRSMQEPPDPRFGDVAIDQLFDGMTRLGCHAAGLQAKVFGGAAVLPFGTNRDTVGDANVRVAIEMLRRYGIPIVTRRTGGHFGVLIRFHTETGDVVVGRLSAPH
jgi:chemotaxis protein CheD